MKRPWALPYLLAASASCGHLSTVKGYGVGITFRVLPEGLVVAGGQVAGKISWLSSWIIDSM